MKKIFTLLLFALTAFTFKSTAQGTTPCNAAFTFQFVNGNTVKFTPAVNDSPLVVHHWTFGDGSPTSTLVSPTHAYLANGTYVVVHTVVRSTPNGAPVCTQSETQTVIIQQAPPVCNLVADYSWNATAANPLVIEFHNLSTPLSPTDSITWIFGDGSANSHDVNPVHTYANAGAYNVCLIVKKWPNTTSTPCIKYICKTVTAQAPCTLVVDFSWNATTTNPLSIEFHNLSTPLSSTDSIKWTFGDGTSSLAVNPVHTYTNPGTYTVCLTVKKNSNVAGTTPCIRTICKTIVIQEPCNLVVDFSWNAAATNPLMIQFNNLSVPLAATDSVTWNFGDGSSSYLVSPLHTYANAGTYNVCLIVKKNNNAPGTTPCIRYICKTVVVQAPCNLVANFTWHADSAIAQKIWFTNTSTPLSTTDSVRWTFGDGTSSNIFNPDHTYSQPGTYTVCLRVQKRNNAGTPINCVSEICKTIVVQPTCNLVANFTWQADASLPQKISFTNTSTPLNNTDSIRWTFGDGSSSSLVSPDHTYAQPGTYTVCLRIQKRNTAGTVSNCVREICKTIVVQPNCNFQANYSWQLDSVNLKKVYFTNLTVVPSTTATAQWFFGDGTSATTWNAVHEYAQPGRYNVCLRVQLSPNCVRYKCDSITVPVPPPPCNNQSNFTAVAASANSQTYTFVPAYQSGAAVYTWTFGDGTGSHDMVATHHYAQAGTYTACLTVWRSSTCASTTCKTVTVTNQINCDSIHVSYTYQFDPFIPNKVYFYANANFPILDQTWTITRLPATTANPVILHQNNPSFIFNDTGYYRVCLRAITLGGCIKEYCSVIHITQVVQQCTLQAYPNPATTQVSVSVALTQPDMINVYVYNALNVLVKEKHQPGVIGNNIVTLPIADLIAGTYTMKVIYGNHYCTSVFHKL